MVGRDFLACCLRVVSCVSLFGRGFALVFDGDTGAQESRASPFVAFLLSPPLPPPRGASLYYLTLFFLGFSFFLGFIHAQVEHAAICEEYEGQMKELEGMLAAGPSSANVSVEQLVKQVLFFKLFTSCLWRAPLWLVTRTRRRHAHAAKTSKNAAGKKEHTHTRARCVIRYSLGGILGRAGLNNPASLFGHWLEYRLTSLAVRAATCASDPAFPHQASAERMTMVMVVAMAANIPQLIASFVLSCTSL